MTESPRNEQSVLNTRSSAEVLSDQSTGPESASGAPIQVSLPVEPPNLTPAAARLLLRILLRAAHEQGLTTAGSSTEVGEPSEE
ncbi:hypothetical protein AB0F81_45270 [Actinoplanes sp. NPDC024001]|uniref:hypothetical protein n=1 Tax=Actinoplanes sp. NPDC024001 TaxID=3154598 RepID=UPI0034096DED